MEGKRPTRPSAQRPGPGPLTNPTTHLRLHAPEDLRLLARHARVRSRQTHPVKATPSLAPPPLNGRADSDDKPDVHPRAAPPSTGTHLVKGLRPTRPSTQRPGTGPLTNPTTRQRPHARLRLGCAPPRGPRSEQRQEHTPNVSPTIYRHPTHFPADLQTVIICGPDLLSIGDLRRPRSRTPATARKTRIRDQKRITILPHHCANVALPLNLT